MAIALARLDRGLGLLLGTAFLVAMSLCAASIGRIQVGPADQVRRRKPVTVLARNLFYKRRLAEILLDVVLVTLAYYGAYRLRFDGALPPGYAEAFQATVGLVIAVNVVAFWAFGVYRGAWQYAGIFDVYRVLGAVALSSVVVMVYGEWRVPALAQSHSIIYIDALLTTALVLSSRLSFRSLERVRDWLLRKGERALIYGAADGGELTLRQLVSSPELRLWPVCFVDDDERTHGAEIHGVPIVGGLESLAPAVARYHIKKIVIGTRNSSPEAVATIRAFAERLGLEIGEVTFAVMWIPKARKSARDARAAR